MGPFRAELAVVPWAVTEDSPPEAWEVIEKLAEEFHAPLSGLMLRYGIDVPASVAGPQLVGAGLAFKALKTAENGSGIVVRCVNVTAMAVEGYWVWPTPIKRAVLSRLDEAPLQEIVLDDERRRVRFTARPREVVTIVVEAVAG